MGWAGGTLSGRRAAEEKRQIERVLAGELAVASEELSRAQARLRIVMRNAVEHGALPPDSNLMVSQACEASMRANEAYRVALDRWKGFVIHGVVPQDL
jgi:hypothetical protein